ncbi:MAG: calcium/sodium antiporter [Thermoguttaceae bacterium]|nr:calcium/sodium antiporter [Thermoguttaceae bacterium]
MEFLIALGWLLAGGALLVIGGEIFVRGATGLALLLKVPPLIIGLTVVAACTGAPEMAVSLTAALSGDSARASIALGNVVGSNICNILLVLGVSALIRPVGISARLVKMEIPFLIAVSALVWLLAGSTPMDAEQTRAIPRWGGAILLALCVGYYIWTVVSVKSGHFPQKSDDIHSQFGAEQAAPAHSRSKVLSLLRSLLFLGAGLAMLVYGADRFVDGAVRIATLLKVSQWVIGLTVVAIGTSLPELTVSILAARSGKNDLAIGNVIGSNTFNILAILGVTALLTTGGIPVSSDAFYIDLPMMILTAVLGSYLCFTDRVLSRREGAVLLLCFAVYEVSLFLR